ncbi:hypothetical protein [Psychrobacillus sp. BM2]|uniref:hypothetical protein n=1 Tax=Psychrobacillus sp. BM2 TaxID=3400421 RepID=UPI003B01F7E4
MRISKQIIKVIQTKVTHSDIYQIKIKGTPGGGCTAYGSAFIAFEKLKTWAEKLGAEVILVGDTFTHKKSGVLIVEITDPAMCYIEKVLEEI